MDRDVVSLDGQWAFSHDSDGAWRQIGVPQPWQAAFADLRHSHGQGTYRRSFSLPARNGRVAVLRFGAVSDIADVWLNGQEIGHHEGGYLPFDCVIPEDLLREVNELEVHCLLPDGMSEPSFGDIPHGKQSWYGPIGGIWQSVQVELRDPCHLDHCKITADLATGAVAVVLTLTGAVGAAVVLRITDPSGQVVATASRSATGAVETFDLIVPDVAPWSPDTPALYRVEVAMARGTVVDTTSHTFGFRTIETRDGQILLNGKPLYMRGALDQDYYPEGICTPPSLAFLEDQLHKARALGLNLLRCHIKVPDPRYYEVADRLGMLIWTEVPNVGTFTDASARRMRQVMEGILARDGNHPSIVIWSLINEDWGIRLCEDAAHRAWLKDSFDWLKALDPTRLVVDNSPCNGNFHVKTDLNDFHYYRSVPERRSEWDALTAEFAGGANWAWSPHGDAVRRGDEPLLVSEFGVWGLPNPAQVTINGAEPWWMETGATWGDGAAYPHGVQDRFAALGLGSVFGSFDQFIDAAQWYQFANLKYEIEEMRAYPSIMGYVITEFTDVHWESNGLLDMNRNPRVFHDRFASINADVVIVPRITRYAGWGGDAFHFDLAVATGGRTLGRSQLHWQAGDQSGVLALGPVGALARADAGCVTVTLPVAAVSQMLRIALTLTEAGQEVAQNVVEIAVYPQRQPASLPKLAVADPQIAACAAGLGYEVVAAAQADIVVTRGLDAADIAAMQAGARYVVMADGIQKTQRNLRVDEPGREQPFVRIVDDTPGLPRGPDAVMPNIGLVARHGTMWRGDWIAGFSWVRRSGPMAALPGGPVVDLSFTDVIPHHVMTGFKPWEFASAVHAGTMVGWVHKPATLIGERRVGRGGLVASTFRLFGDAPGADPVAATLFDALIGLASQMRVESRV